MDIIKNMKDLIINVGIILILILVVLIVTYKYIYKFNYVEAIYNFNKSYNDIINNIYLYFYYDKNTNTLTTNYELNNGLFKDLKENLTTINL
jgi:hypothetical protein